MLTTTGVLMRYILPPGDGRFSTIWGFDRHAWGSLHFWISFAFFSLLAVHLFLHWRWIVHALTGHPREGSGLRAGLGVIGLITVTALAISPLLAPIEKDHTVSSSRLLSGHQYEDISIQGAMTLKELERTTGVPASYIIESLKLPPTVSTKERLGRLKKDYGIEMNDVRDIILQYNKEK